MRWSRSRRPSVLRLPRSTRTPRPTTVCPIEEPMILVRRTPQVDSWLPAPWLYESPTKLSARGLDWPDVLDSISSPPDSRPHPPRMSSCNSSTIAACDLDWPQPGCSQPPSSWSGSPGVSDRATRYPSEPRLPLGTRSTEPCQRDLVVLTAHRPDEARLKGEQPGTVTLYRLPSPIVRHVARSMHSSHGVTPTPRCYSPSPPRTRVGGDWTCPVVCAPGRTGVPTSPRHSEHLRRFRLPPRIAVSDVQPINSLGFWLTFASQCPIMAVM